MKVYLNASARGFSDFGDNYIQIYDLLEDLGNQHVDDSLNRIDDERFYSGSHEEKVREFETNMQAIKSADVVILEVSVHSLSMGYILNRALELGKPVIALYLKGHEPTFAQVIEDDRLQVVEYNLDNLKKVIQSALEESKDQADTRFNFFISPRQLRYLDAIARTQRIPRSVFLRRLIEQDMEINKEYQEAI